MIRSLPRQFWWVALFAVAMAFLESAVVVYLRALYYPEGFSFPLVPIDRELGIAEVFREAATLIMLLTPGALISRNAIDRFAWFCLAFGVWDIFYYLWLFVLIGWPSSFFEWDILFLIPVPWVGPVLAPCVVSLGLIVLALIIHRGRGRVNGFTVGRSNWILLAIGAGAIITSFLIDPLRHLHLSDTMGQAWSIARQGERTFDAMANFVPRHYPWVVFLVGCGLTALGMVGLWRRAERGRVAH